MTSKIDTNETAAYWDPTLPTETRVRDLIARMTLEEKVSQMVNLAAPVERLGIKPYEWWNECLHGVARAGIATVFPQAIGLAASWDTDLIHRFAVATSDEGRAKYHEAQSRQYYKRYFGLTFWTPNINIFRDPRWGRGQETYGEDPYLTARLGVAFVHGLQGDDPKYLKAVACAKHYAVHSGPEGSRHTFDARVSKRDMYDMYLPAFRALVTEAKVESVMGAYNRVNGEACNASPTLLHDILRGEWGFQGHVVSDCGAVEDIYTTHNLFRLKEEAVARAVKAGCDLCCGQAYDALGKAVEQGFITEAELDVALIRLFTARFKLGMFDPDESVPYAKIPYSVVHCEAHQQLALQAARESIVLLKNDGILPLKAGQYKTIGVLGPNAHDSQVLQGNYNGLPAAVVTPLDGIIARAFPDANVMFSPGCPLIGEENPQQWAASELIDYADLLIVVLGLNAEMEGEEGAGGGTGDRGDLALPAVQQHLLEQVHATGKPFILVLLNGSMIAVNWAQEHAPAIVEAWYPGEAGGTAIAEVLFGDYNPAGRLPVTFYRSTEQLPLFEDYAVAGHTYRYFTGEVLYPFGYGLSYTTFQYRNLRADKPVFTAADTVTVSVEVQNTGHVAGDEVVQLYLRDLAASVPVPNLALQGFRRIHLAPGETQTVTFTLTPEQFSALDDDGRPFLEPGTFRLSAGGKQPGQPTLSAGESNVVEIEVTAV